MGKLTDAVKNFYESDSFLEFYTSSFRLKQIKKALASKHTSAAERLQYLKYLDAHVGDVPKEGQDSGRLYVNLQMILED